jgi:hypothetical protein
VIYCFRRSSFFLNSVAEGSVVSAIFPCGSFGAVGITLYPGRGYLHWAIFIISLALSFYLGRKSFVHELDCSRILF